MCSSRTLQPGGLHLCTRHKQRLRGTALQRLALDHQLKLQGTVRLRLSVALRPHKQKQRVQGTVLQRLHLCHQLLGKMQQGLALSLQYKQQLQGTALQCKTLCCRVQLQAALLQSGPKLQEHMPPTAASAVLVVCKMLL
jgi:hypothetical protein